MYTLTIRDEPQAGRGRPVRFYTYDGITLTGTQWAAALGISGGTFYRRLRAHKRNPMEHPLQTLFREHFATRASRAAGAAVVEAPRRNGTIDWEAM